MTERQRGNTVGTTEVALAITVSSDHSDKPRSTPLVLDSPETLDGIGPLQVALLCGGASRYVGMLVLDLHEQGVVTSDAEGRVTLGPADGAATADPYRGDGAVMPHETHTIIQACLKTRGPTHLSSLCRALGPQIAKERHALCVSEHLVRVGSPRSYAVAATLTVLLVLFGVWQVAHDISSILGAVALPLAMGGLTYLLRPSLHPRDASTAAFETFRVELESHAAAGVPLKLLRSRRWQLALNGFDPAGFAPLRVLERPRAVTSGGSMPGAGLYDG